MEHAPTLEASLSIFASAARTHMMNNASLISAYFSQAATSALDEVQTVHKALTSITCPPIRTLKPICFRDLSEKQIERLIAEVPAGYSKTEQTTDYIYLIRLHSKHSKHTSTLQRLLKEFREISKDYCQVNRHPSRTNILYVGRSQKLKRRLREHLGANSRRTYALHLQRWATEVDAKISISFIEFRNADDLLVQAIEDGFWDSLKPVFGRKGAR